MRDIVFCVMLNVLNCWNCGKTVEEVHFCGSCRSLQAPSTNYYDFFGLDHRLDLDLKDLETRFYTLSRRLHPDVYFRRSARERQFSLDATAILNDGYRTLRNPVARAEYLLREQGFDIGEQKSANAPPELLEEVFELNEVLEELREGDEAARPQLEAAEKRFLAMREEIDRDLGGLFRAYDQSRDRAVLCQVRGLLNRRKYVRNLIHEVEKELVS